MSNVLCIVPARAGSKRLVGKNTKELGGKPLVQWALDAAVAAQRVDVVVASSDSDEVLALAEATPGVRALRRPVELCQDTSTAIEYVHHALGVVEGETGTHFDTVVIVQATSPFTEAADIDACIELLWRKGGDSAVSVMALDHAIHPLKLKVMHEQQLLPYLEEEKGRMASHEIDELYARNGSVYVSTRATVDDDDLLGAVSHGHVMPQERSIDINTPLDFAFASFLLQRQKAPDSDVGHDVR